MPTSGVTTFIQNTYTLISDAYNKLGILAEGESLSAIQLSQAKRVLNSMIHSWESDDVHLWKYKEATVFLQKAQGIYVLGDNQSHCSEVYIETDLKLDALQGTNSITVNSVIGISDGDFIGIELNNGNAQWTTVDGTPIGDVITLTDSLLDDVDISKKVISYQEKITKPVKISQARYVPYNSTNEIICVEYSRKKYFEIADKLITGISTQYYYQPRRLDTLLYLWATPESTFSKFNITYYPDFEVFINSDDSVDFPTEWYECLVYNLAERLAPGEGYSEDNSTYKTVARNAMTLYDKLKRFDNETLSVNITVNDGTGVINSNGY